MIDDAIIPSAVTLNVCRKCGRNNRMTDLRIGARWHYTEGARCYGTVEALTYVLALPPITQLSDRDLSTITDAVVRALVSDAAATALHARVLDALTDRLTLVAPTEG